MPLILQKLFGYNKKRLAYNSYVLLLSFEDQNVHQQYLKIVRIALKQHPIAELFVNYLLQLTID